MTLVFVDGFEASGSWFGPGGTLAVDSRRSGFRGVHVEGIADIFGVWIPGGPKRYTSFGFGYKRSEPGPVAELLDDAGHCHFSLRADGYGKLHMWTPNAVGGYSNKTWLRKDKWYYVECVFDDDDSGGGSLYLNGSLESTISRWSSDIDTPEEKALWPWTGSYILQLGYYTFAYWNGDAAFDDLYIATDSVALTPLGDSSTQSLAPTGAGSSATWTPSSGANWTCVDEVDPDGDTSYVETATANATDLYAFEDTALSGGIHAVQVLFQAQAQGVGQRGVAAVAKLGANLSYGTTYYPRTVGYVSYGATFLTKPGGGTWTASDVNNLEAGVIAL